jgi:GntR family transcriptional regulator / MocR family aminotransferase
MQQGVGIRPISPMYALGAKHRSQNCAGLVLGYASLSLDAIHEGIKKLAVAVERLR